jgi:hypothetical protein
LIEKTQQVYHDYVSLKLHFNQPDYYGHTFSVNTKLMNINIKTRNDYLYFYQLGSYFKSRKAMNSYLLSGFIKNVDMWIGDFIIYSDDLIPLHQSRIKRCSNLIQVFDEDCSIIHEKDSNLKTLLKTDKSAPPIMFIPNINKETLAVLDYFTNFTQYAKDTLDISWKRDALSINKYKWFLKIDHPEILKILKKYFTTR